MRRICAWCGKSLGLKFMFRPTHGICPACAARLKGESVIVIHRNAKWLHFRAQLGRFAAVFAVWALLWLCIYAVARALDKGF